MELEANILSEELGVAEDFVVDIFEAVPLGLYECLLGVMVGHHFLVLLHVDFAGGHQLLGYDGLCLGPAVAHRKSHEAYSGIGQSYPFEKVVVPHSVDYDPTISHSHQMTGSYLVFALLSVDYDVVPGVLWVAGYTPPPVPNRESPMDPVDWNSLDI